MTKLTTKQFRAIVREEVAKFPGYIIDRSYTDNRKGPSSNLRSCAFYIYAKGNHKALENVYQAVRARVVALGSDNLPTMSRFWLRMTQLELAPKQ